MKAPLLIPFEVSQEVWNLLFDWIPGTGSCGAETCQLSTAGVIVYVLGLIILGILIREGRKRRKSGSSTDASETEGQEKEEPSVTNRGLELSHEFEDLVTEDEKPEEKSRGDLLDETKPDQSKLPRHLGDDHDPEEFFCDLEELHQRQIAPNRVEKGDTSYKLGDQYRRVLFAHDYDDTMPIGALKPLIEDPNTHFDVTIHFHAMDREKTLRSVKSLYETLGATADADGENDELTAEDKIRRREKVADYRDEIKNNNQRPVSLSTYVSVADSDREELLDTVDMVRKEFRKEADIQLKTIERDQKLGLISASPIGYDAIKEEHRDIDPCWRGLGSSFGALLAGVHQSRKFEPTGHEWGIHTTQGHPIVKDPFKSKTNLNMTVVGKSGTGKSVNTKAMCLSTKATHKDTLMIILDPLQGFYGLAEALDAKKITVGGQQKLNPMEIRKPPEEHLESEAFDEDRDPLTSKVDDVMAFIQNYVSQQPGLAFGNESQLLRSLILQAYKQRGITHDVSTHDKESPTLRFVLELAQHAKENPETWATGPQSLEEVQKQAAEIGNMLREFGPGGQYENLAQQPEEDIFGEDNDVIYLDLSQQEGSGGIGIMGQLMFSLAYEKCKEYPGPSTYVIDEARYLFKNQSTLDYLAQRVRHSRHYTTSIRFVTQEMDDFFEFPQAEGIINNSAFQVIHKSPDIDEWGDRFGLNEAHKSFVKNAATGEEKPYSQALVQFPDSDKWYPLNIELGERMLAIADFDEQEERYEQLPGRGVDTIDQSPMTRELIARIRNQAHKRDQVLQDIFEDWELSLWDILDQEQARKCIQEIRDGKHPREALYVAALEEIEWVVRKAGAEDTTAEAVVDELESAIVESYEESSQTETVSESQLERLEQVTTGGTGVDPIPTEDTDENTGQENSIKEQGQQISSDPQVASEADTIEDAVEPSSMSPEEYRSETGGTDTPASNSVSDDESNDSSPNVAEPADKSSADENPSQEGDVIIAGPPEDGNSGDNQNADTNDTDGETGFTGGEDPFSTADPFSDDNTDTGGDNEDKSEAETEADD